MASAARRRGLRGATQTGYRVIGRVRNQEPTEEGHGEHEIAQFCKEQVEQPPNKGERPQVGIDERAQVGIDQRPQVGIDQRAAIQLSERGAS
jgi:hypothetical protein